MVSSMTSTKIATAADCGSRAKRRRQFSIQNNKQQQRQPQSPQWLPSHQQQSIIQLWNLAIYLIAIHLLLNTVGFISVARADSRSSSVGILFPTAVTSTGE